MKEQKSVEVIEKKACPIWEVQKSEKQRRVAREKKEDNATCRLWGRWKWRNWLDRLGACEAETSLPFAEATQGEETLGMVARKR
jgi:hypothetical protein